MRNLALVFPLIILLMSSAKIPNDPNGPRISFDFTEYNADTVLKGSKLKVVFPFTNTGKEPLVIGSIYGGCACVCGDASTYEPIQPGQTEFISVSYDTNWGPGAFDKTAEVMHNGMNDHGETILHLRGFVKAQK